MCCTISFILLKTSCIISSLITIGWSGLVFSSLMNTVSKVISYFEVNFLNSPLKSISVRINSSVPKITLAILPFSIGTSSLFMKPSRNNTYFIKLICLLNTDNPVTSWDNNLSLIISENLHNSLKLLYSNSIISLFYKFIPLKFNF